MYKKIKTIVKSNRFLYSLCRWMMEAARFIYRIYSLVYSFYFEACYHLRNIGFMRSDRVLCDLKNKHKNKRIFIVATGPSLLNSDLEWLHEHHEITISCNGIFRILGSTNWRPSYYVIEDRFWYKKNKNDFTYKIEDIPENAAIMAKPIKKHIDYKIDKSKIGFFPECTLDHIYNKKVSNKFVFRENIAAGYYHFYTVTCAAIILAGFMGASEVYLLGVDCNYTGPDVHVGVKGNDLRMSDSKTAENSMIDSYNFLNEKISRSNFKIYNATRGGKLEVFERKSMDEIIGNGGV